MAKLSSHYVLLSFPTYHLSIYRRKAYLVPVINSYYGKNLKALNNPTIWDTRVGEASFKSRYHKTAIEGCIFPCFIFLANNSEGIQAIPWQGSRIPFIHFYLGKGTIYKKER